MLAESGPELEDASDLGPSNIDSANVQFFHEPDPTATANPSNPPRMPFDHGGWWSLHDRKPDLPTDTGASESVDPPPTGIASSSTQTSEDNGGDISWFPIREWAEAESNPRVEAVEFSGPGQAILVGYGLSEVNDPPFGWHGREPDMPEENRFMLIGGPTAQAAVNESAAKGFLPAVAERENRNDFPVISLQLKERILAPPARASMTSFVIAVATSLNGRHLIIADDDGTLHLCYRYSGMELCQLKQSPDGVWRAIAQPNRFLSTDDFTETAPERGGRELDPARLAAIDPFLQHFLLAIIGDQGQIFSFSLSGVR